MDLRMWCTPLGADDIPTAMGCRVCGHFERVQNLENHVCKRTKVDKLFTYGSLMEGGANHDVLVRAKAKFLKKDSLEAIKIPTKFPFPAITEGLGLVLGEVYEIDRNGLIRLDFFEGHPEFYQRREVHTESGERVWAYFGTGVIGAGVKVVEAVPDTPGPTPPLVQ